MVHSLSRIRAWTEYKLDGLEKFIFSEIRSPSQGVRGPHALCRLWGSCLMTLSWLLELRGTPRCSQITDEFCPSLPLSSHDIRCFCVLLFLKICSHCIMFSLYSVLIVYRAHPHPVWFQVNLYLKHICKSAICFLSICFVHDFRLRGKWILWNFIFIARYWCLSMSPS